MSHLPLSSSWYFVFPLRVSSESVYVIERLLSQGFSLEVVWQVLSGHLAKQIERNFCIPTKATVPLHHGDLPGLIATARVLTQDLNLGEHLAGHIGHANITVSIIAHSWRLFVNVHKA